MSYAANKMNYQLILHVILVLLGIFLVILPGKGLIYATVVLAIALMGTGLVCGAIFFLSKNNRKNYMLIIGIAALVLGILAIIFRMQIALIVLPIIIGLWIIASAVLCIMAALNYRKQGAPLWWLPLIASLVAIILAFFVFANLSGTARLLARIIGIYFIVFSAIRIGEFFTLRKYIA